MIGAQVLPLIGRDRDELTLSIGNLSTGLGIAGIGLAPLLPLAFAAAVVGGAGNGLVNVAQNSLISRRIPADKTGRAFAASNALIQLAIGGGTAAAVPLIHLLRADGAMLMAGGLAGIASLAAAVLAVRRNLQGSRRDR